MRRSSPPGQEEGPAAGPDEPPRGGRPRDHSLDDTILKATRRLLTRSGYSQMTIADIAAESGVSRPTIYRRWPGKFELVAAALDYGLAHAQDAYSATGRSRPSGAYERFRLAAELIDPCYANPDAIILQGNFIGETDRTPALLDLLRTHAVEPRLSYMEQALRELRDEGAIRRDIDLRTVTTMCFGTFFGAHLRGERDHLSVAENTARTMWDFIATGQ